MTLVYSLSSRMSSIEDRKSFLSMKTPNIAAQMTILHVRPQSEMLLRRIFGFTDEKYAAGFDQKAG
ncbi:hypothetical protein MMC07_003224 [Pseudocyphellaria aurata]|nr:hypothetical protein [Pseudocyphellaria aurata]